MHVSLTDQLEKMVKAKVASGYITTLVKLSVNPYVLWRPTRNRYTK